MLYLQVAAAFATARYYLHIVPREINIAKFVCFVAFTTAVLSAAHLFNG
jgi:type IV secretory pathway component VirB8